MIWTIADLIGVDDRNDMESQRVDFEKKWFSGKDNLTLQVHLP